MISHETIKEFQQVIEVEFGIIKSELEAKEILLNMVDYFDLLARIDCRTEYQVS